MGEVETWLRKNADTMCQYGARISRETCLENQRGGLMIDCVGCKKEDEIAQQQGEEGGRLTDYRRGIVPDTRTPLKKDPVVQAPPPNVSPVDDILTQLKTTARKVKKRGAVRSGICLGCGHQGSLFSKRYNLCMGCFRNSYEKLQNENRRLRMELAERDADEGN